MSKAKKRIRNTDPRNPFEEMVLQIPLSVKGVSEFHSLPLCEQEILSDEIRAFVELKLQAFAAFKPKPYINDLAERVATHPNQLKSSFTPKMSKQVHGGCPMHSDDLIGGCPVHCAEVVWERPS